MEKIYKRKYKEDTENSLSTIMNKDQISKFVQFIKNNPFPTDDQVHTWAMTQDFSIEIIENIAYALLTVIFCGGKSKGKDLYNIKDGELQKGMIIEEEHVSFDKYKNNEIVNYMQVLFKNKITQDHLTEHSNYNSELLKLEDILKSKKVL